MYIRLMTIKDTVMTLICLATKKAVPRKKEPVAVDARNRLRMNGRKKRSREAVTPHGRNAVEKGADGCYGEWCGFYKRVIHDR